MRIDRISELRQTVMILPCSGFFFFLIYCKQDNTSLKGFLKAQFVCVYVSVCEPWYMCTMLCVWRSEDNLKKSFFFLHNMDSGY